MRPPRVTAKVVEKVAKRMGFVFKRHGRGSHDIWQHPVSKRILVISYHAGEIVKPKTMKNMLESLQLKPAEFLAKL